MRRPQLRPSAVSVRFIAVNKTATQPMKVMIVDDHAGVRNIIRQVLNAPDRNLIECATGEEAVRVARDFEPDFVTMDVRLPGLSGLEAARAIRGFHPTCRIVIVSSYDQPLL